ncbi:hypothetical protein MUN87_19865 [Gracilibacillus salinarum]|uniref:Uncharacterized protein n=2 Tax=Gracilibacillus TaxID=74385 RepID=A0ABY4GT25_9BACI|nr:hypothetical protein [Gracilibacillus caseinilyticus]UOQ50672.1 hypothetical protein MUN88_00170 [Gracilibacillus caseinilyticus]UOQ87548.1 hypothetical protein MUN87_19865 [Gracilibacillus salinarum]
MLIALLALIVSIINKK